MPQPNDRGDFGNLRRPVTLPQTKSPETSAAEEARFLNIGSPTTYEAGTAAVPQPAVSYTATIPQENVQTKLAIRPGKKLVQTRQGTFRIPVPLMDRLSSIAEYNSITMADIVIEALELHLPKFPYPPGLK